MLIDIYLLFWVIAWVLAVLSFKFKNIILPFLAMSFFFFLGISSAAIEIPFCAIGSTGEWSCYNYVKNDFGLSYLGYGLGIIMLIFAIYTALSQAGESVERGVQ